LRASRPWDTFGPLSVPPVGRYPPSWIIQPPLTIQILPARSIACKGASRRWDIYIGFGTDLELFSVLPRASVRALRVCSQGAFEGEHFIGRRRSIRLETCPRPTIRAGPIPGKSSAAVRPILHPEEPLTDPTAGNQAPAISLH
jgi:hypothetical protein